MPGSDGAVDDEKIALRIAEEIGYPVIIKAAAGGGGRGMRVAHNDVSLRAGLKQAQAEAENAFKDSTVYIEKYVEFGRHVEVQILADNHGNAVHLWERDCSMQRRHQKLVEESPSPVLKQETPRKTVRIGRAPDQGRRSTPTPARWNSWSIKRRIIICWKSTPASRSSIR